MRSERSRSKPRALIAALLILLPILPLAAANDVHEQGTGFGSFDYIKAAGTANEHSLGTGFYTSTQFAATKIHHIDVYLQRVGNPENACVLLSLRSDFGGPNLISPCVTAANVPTTAGWVTFNLDPQYAITPGATYFVFVQYYGSCSTCMKMFWSDTNTYRSGDWPTTKYGQDGTSCCWYVSNTDIAFRVAESHTPLIVTRAARDVTSSSATLVGGDDDDSGGLQANFFFRWGTTTSYGQTTGTWSCPQFYECSIGINGLQAGTTYHYRACATNEVGEQCGVDVTFATSGPPNNPPYEPSNPSPFGGASGVSTGTGLSWSGGDPDGHAVTYDVYLDAGGTASTLRCSGVSSTSCPNGNLGGLLPGTQYAWRVVARDSLGATRPGPAVGAWGFTTAGCDANAPVVLWEGAGFTGGCLALYGNDNDFVDNAFNTGGGMNDQVSAIQVKPGQHAILYSENNFNGAPGVFSASDSNLADNGLDEKASSLRVLPCDPNAKVVLFEHSDYTGGCAAFNADDVDFTNNVLSNGVGLNDQLTSLWIKEGHTATLFADINDGGAAMVLARHDAGLGDEGFNDAASGLRIGGPPSPPGNDALDRAALVTGPYVYNARLVTSGAGTQASETTLCGGTSYGSTVWFKFTARGGGTARISTWGSDYNTVLAAYAGTSVTSPSVGCNNDGGGTAQSRLEFACVEGQEYRVQVGGVGSASATSSSS